MRALYPNAIDATTGRTLLVTEDSEQVMAQAVGPGAIEASPVSDEHGGASD